MERSDPALVPEWLKNAGSSNGGGSVSHSDDHSVRKLARNKSSVNSTDPDFGRSFSSDRTTSSYFRRSSSSNGSGHLNPYSSFGRSRHDRDWEKDTYDRNKLALGDRRQRNFSDPQENALSIKFERDGLRRSQSMISGKRGDSWPKKVITESSASGNSNNGLLSKGSPVGVGNKASFEKEFPSLGTEERAITPELRRIPSPGLSSAIQSLPIGSSVITGGEKWTSALAEVPDLVGSNGTGISSSQQAAPSNSSASASASASSKNTSLNMAEAVAQVPSRAQTTPQLSVGTQRLEELAIKQSRQLIPVTPSMPKTLHLNSSDKQKTKVGQQHHVSSSLAVNLSPRGIPVKSDVLKASNMGKLHVLKPAREKNGVTQAVKDKSSPAGGGKPVSSTVAATPSVSVSATARGPPNNPAADRKPVSAVLEKRPTVQAQSRNDFFNLVRKKSTGSPSSVADSTNIASLSSVVATGTSESAPSSDKLAEIEVPTPTSSQPVNAGCLSGVRSETTGNGNACEARDCGSTENKQLSSNPIKSEEEEAAFLRSLGWDENSDEGGLTEEEISAFFMDISKQYMNSEPSLKKLQEVQPKLLLAFDSKTGALSSGFNSSGAKMES